MAVRCPNCGNTNDEGSKFCNSCGHKLDADVRGLCPECGGVNPPSNIFCDKCGARLFSAMPSMDAESDEGSVRGLSLPSKDPSDDDDAPDWLAQLRSSFGEETDQVQPEISDKLEDVQVSKPVSRPEVLDSPTGLSAAAPAESIDMGRKSSDSPEDQEGEIPDWLRDALSEAAPVPAEAAAPSDVAAPTSGADQAGLDAGELPDWLAELSPPEGPSALDQVQGDDQSPASQSESDLPTMIPPGSGIESGDLPDWLQDLEAEPAGLDTGEPETPTASAEETAAEPDDLPEWIQEGEAAETILDSGISEVDAPPTDDAVAEPDDLPEWLQELAPKQSAPDPETSVPEPAPIDAKPGGLMDWLQEAESTETVPDEGTPDLVSLDKESGEPDDLPEWLQELEPKQSAPDPETSVPKPAPIDAEPGDLMGWLQEVGSAATAPDEGASDLASLDIKESGEPDDLPDWLQEAAAAKTVQEEEGKPELEAGEMPDWLQRLRPQEATAEETAPDTVTGKEDLEPGKLPDWLQEYGTAETAREESPEDKPQPVDTPALQTGDLPDWLQAIGPPEDDKAPEPDVPEAITPSDLTALPQEIEPATIDTGELSPLDEEKGEPAALPDWLQAVDQVTADSPSLIDKEGEDLPDWLQDFALEGDSDVPGLAPPAPLIPDQRAPEPQAPAESLRPRTPTPTRAEASVLTDWLGETTAPLAPLGESGPTKALGGTGPLVPPELPDWLAAVDDSSSSKLPAWLDQDDDADALLGVDKSVPREEEATAALPSWLTDEDVGLELPKEETTQTEAELEPGELPDWLKLAPAAGGQPGLGADALSDQFIPAGGLDAADAVRDLDRAPFSTRDAAVDTGLAQQLGLVQAEIPDWLQALKPQEAPERPAVLEAAESLEPVEKGGFLDGVRGALVAQAEVSILPAGRVLPSLAPTEQHQAHAQVLEQIVHAGPGPLPDITQERRAQAWLERLVIPLLILAAVLFPFAAGLFPEFGGNPLQDILGERADSLNASRTFDLLNNELASESLLVIAAFDYSPAEAGELDPVSTAILRHLVGQGARVLAVSTTPTGPEIAQNVMEKVAADHDYQYAEDFVNLGYIPGGAPGLKAFATDPWGMFSGTDYLGRVSPASTAPAAAELGPSLENADVLLIFTADRNDLIGWIEQVGRPEEMQGVQMVAGVSAGLEPWAQPYFQSSSEQLDGLVSGIPDAAQYERQVNQLANVESRDDASSLQDGQVLGLGVIILLISVGLLWGIGQGLVNRRRADG